MIDFQREATRLASRYPEGRSRSALIPLLHRAQQAHGYVTGQAIIEIAGVLGLTTAEVRSVATFYTMFHLEPKGRHVVSVCHNLACTLAGATSVIEGLEAHFGVRCGQTTKDGEFTLERAECLAACDLAPMIQIDYDAMIGPLDPTSAVARVEEVRGKAPAGGISEVLGAQAAAVSGEVTGTEREEFGPYVSSGQAPAPAVPMSTGPELPGPEPTPPTEGAAAPEEVAATAAPQEKAATAAPQENAATEEDEDDFVREDDAVKEPYSKAPSAPVPSDETRVAVGEPVEPSDTTAGPEGETAPIDYSTLRGTRKSKVASERLYSVPPLPEGVGPGPADPKDIGAPDPKAGEPVRRPRGAE